MPTVHERLIQERMAESYRAAYAAGVASRDAEVARLRGALADAIGIRAALNQEPHHAAE